MGTVDGTSDRAGIRAGNHVGTQIPRARNAWRRLVHLLPPSGEVVSPEVPNDLYQAHLSLYLFAASFARGRAAVDLACGTGYGSARLLAAGASRVVGIEADPWRRRYARRRFGRAGVDFRAGEPGELPADLAPVDLAVAIGALPRAADPDRALAGIASRLAPGGLLVASLPPILDGQALAAHQARKDEPSAMYLWDWEERLRERFAALRLFRHLPPPGRQPDFADPRPSTLAAEAFRCEEIPLAEIYDVGSLGAVFVAGPA